MLLLPGFISRKFFCTLVSKDPESWKLIIIIIVIFKWKSAVSNTLDYTECLIRAFILFILMLISHILVVQYSFI